MSKNEISQDLKVFHKNLKDIKILDFSRLLPGPFASSMLSAMGAKITCILPPSGDAILSSYSPFDEIRKGKKFMTADLKNEKIKKKILKMVKDVDVVMEGFRPGVMEKLGFGFKQLKKINSKLIYVSMTGYAVAGTKGKLGGHDLNFLIEAGVYDHIYPKGSTHIPAIQIADLAAGYLMAMQVLSALTVQHKKRQAVHIQLSIQEAARLLGFYLIGAEHLIPTLTGSYARYHMYQSADGGRLMAACIEDHFYKNFLKTIGLHEISENQQIMIARVQNLIEQKALAEWKKIFSKVDACVSFLD